MQITHQIDKFLKLIFPELKSLETDDVIEYLKKFYTINGVSPTVTIEGITALVSVSEIKLPATKIKFQNAINLCEAGKFGEAKIILKELIEENPSNSEYYRILGQILSEEGDQDQAIDILIDALRWDSKNGWALLMMGNIFAKYKSDIDTALKYYNQALVSNSKDYITMTNIGYMLFQLGKLDESKEFLTQAIEINPNYNNALLSLAFVEQKQNNLSGAFQNVLQAIKTSKKNDEVYLNAIKVARDIAEELSTAKIGFKIFTDYKVKLEMIGGTKVDILEDETIATPAKIEFAENYQRVNHIVKYKANHIAVEHLIMHELVHLDFVIEARLSKLNQLFISDYNHKQKFIEFLSPTIKKLEKVGLGRDMLEKYTNSILLGMNSQVFNTPVDLFIENKLYTEFTELRPFQFVSLFRLITDGIKATTDPQVLQIAPIEIISVSKIYNIVNALQFKDLFGVNLLDDFGATQLELTKAQKLYSEFLEYRDSREPAEEYELVKHWAEDLKLDMYFELVSELEYRNHRSDIDTLLSSIENNPYSEELEDPFRERLSKKFIVSHTETGVDSTIITFMIHALSYFKEKKKEEIIKIAFEIATIGEDGISPRKEGYKVPSIPNKSFQGGEFLAYYYVSWALGIPDKLEELGLPYKKEFDIAFQLSKNE